VCGKSHMILLLVICFWYAVGYFAYLYCNNVDHGNKRVSSSNYWLSIWPFYIMFLNICNDINIYRSFGLICMAWIWLTFFLLTVSSKCSFLYKSCPNRSISDNMKSISDSWMAWFEMILRKKFGNSPRGW